MKTLDTVLRFSLFSHGRYRPSLLHYPVVTAVVVVVIWVRFVYRNCISSHTHWPTTLVVVVVVDVVRVRWDK